MPVHVCTESVFLSQAMLTAETARDSNDADAGDVARDAHQQQRKRKDNMWLTRGPVHLKPKQRYCFWTPKGLRGRDDMSSRTSACITLWYINLKSVLNRREFIKIASVMVQTCGS